MQGEISNLSGGIDGLMQGPIGDMVRELPLIGPICDTLTNSFEGFSNVISAVGNYDKVVEKLREAGYGFETLKSGVEGANALCAQIIPTFLGLCSSLSLTTIATGIQTTVTSLLTGALNLCKVAMANLPLIVTLVAVAALVTGIILLTKHFNESSESQKKLSAETTALKTKNDDLTKSINDNNIAYKDSTEQIGLQAGATQTLADKVFELSEKEGKSLEEKRELSALEFFVAA